MAELNGEYMGKTGPTDVLSFPIEDFAGGITEPDAEGPPLLLGDILICPAVVRANAAAAEVPFEDEMALMVVHGILHLLGNDHVIERKRRKWSNESGRSWRWSGGCGHDRAGVVISAILILLRRCCAPPGPLWSAPRGQMLSTTLEIRP